MKWDKKKNKHKENKHFKPQHTTFVDNKEILIGSITKDNISDNLSLKGFIEKIQQTGEKANCVR